MIHHGMATRWCNLHRGISLIIFLKILRCMIHCRTVTLLCIIHHGMATQWCILHCLRPTPCCILHRGDNGKKSLCSNIFFWYTFFNDSKFRKLRVAKKEWLSSVFYTAEWWPGGVWYTAELHSKNQNNLGCVRYTAEWRLCSVSYTQEAFAKQMKATTALKGTILQKTDQNCSLLPYMVNMNLNFFLMSSF